MSYCWTDAKLCKLVQLYSKFNNLWDKRDPCYDNLRSRHTSYKKILASLSMPGYVSVSNVIAKLKELRTTYVTELKKIETASKTGCIYKPSQSWFEKMNEFLYDHLDTDEKFSEYPSSEEDTTSSKEEILTKESHLDCCTDLNSVTESDSESSSSIDPVKKNPVGPSRRHLRPARKSQAYFLRSPTILRSTIMNTKYELPRRAQISSPIPVTHSPSRKEASVNRAEDVQQCLRLEVKMTWSEVSMKYMKTEIVDGDEKCYRKNLKGPRCSTGDSSHFKNIKMVISKSGYSPGGSRSTSNERDDENTELRDMICMLNLQGVPSSLTKLEETDCSPSTSCSSITSADSLLRMNSLLRNFPAKNCCEGSTVEEIKELKRGGTISETCPNKIPKVVCLGDGTMFEENLMNLLQDSSIKICPVEVGCGSGNCTADQTGDVLPCRTCSAATRPVKEYEFDAAKSVSKMPTRGDELSTSERNIDEGKTTSNKSGAADEGSEGKKEGDNSMSKVAGKFDSSIPEQAQRNYDLKVLLKSADRRSLSERNPILRDARKELWEAGRLYNNGKYVGMRGILDSDLERGEPSEFDSFGTEVASSLKMMGKHQAMKLKRAIAETLQLDDKRNRSDICERDKWSENKLCRLVCLYRKFPCLWKKDDPSYMDNSTRHCAYSSIHQKMEMPNVTFTEVMIKIREVRRAYVNELQKILMAHKVGQRYEMPRHKWFINLHKFLYQYLDFDEVAELQDPEDSVSSCYRQDDDEDEDSQYVDTDSEYNADSSVDGSKNYRCRRTPRISCDSSQAGSSTMNDSPSAYLNSKQYSSPGIEDPCKIKLKHNCPFKIIECSNREYTTASEICDDIRKTPRSKKSTSVTIICDKKADLQCPKNEATCNAKRKLSICKRKEPFIPEASSVNQFGSNDSLLNVHDEFDVFAKSVACQLRKMDIESAVVAQNQIQNVLTDQRLCKSQVIRPEISETKDLGVGIQKLPSPQQSATRVRSRVIRPAMSKRLLTLMNPNVRTSEIRIDERPTRGTASRLSDPTPQRKTERNSLK